MSADTLRRLRVLETTAAPLPPVLDAEGEVDEASRAATSTASPPPIDEFPLGRRHAILRLRVAASSPPELSVLQTLAIAGRPVTAELLANVACGLPAEREQRVESVLAALARLEEREIVGRQGPEGWPGGDEVFFVRLWDYVPVALETVGTASRAALHQRIGEAWLARLEHEGDEVAYEVYFHFRRGTSPRSSIPYGLKAAERFLRSFALEKARRVYLSHLPLLTPSRCAGGSRTTVISMSYRAAHISTYKYSLSLCQ